MLYCPNFFWNVLQVWMAGKDVYLQMTWSWPDKTWNILCSYCLRWNTSQSKFRNHYFLFLFAFSILSQLFLIWGCILELVLCCGLSVNDTVVYDTNLSDHKPVLFNISVPMETCISLSTVRKFRRLDSMAHSILLQLLRMRAWQHHLIHHYIC